MIGFLPPVDCPSPISFTKDSSISSVTILETVALFNPLCLATSALDIGPLSLIVSNTRDLFIFFINVLLAVCVVLISRAPYCYYTVNFSTFFLIIHFPLYCELFLHLYYYINIFYYD